MMRMTRTIRTIRTITTAALLILLLLLLALTSVTSFPVLPLQIVQRRMLTVGVTTSSSLSSTTNDLQQQQQQQQQQDEIAKQFKILTCSATSCAKQRTILGMDPFATYGAFYNRIQEGQYPHIALEEVSCLGSCQQAPCVAVEHEDFEGTVALEGMTENEFNERV